jgi:hypothetical protein
VVRDATASPLWQVVNEFFPKLVDYVGRHDQYVPAFVERELEAFLACGRIDHGFSHIRCRSCDARQLVPLTCKSRALCPTCCGRRMNQTALHLVESVIPHVPVRQWVVTFPPPLRYLFAYDTALCSRALGIFVKCVLSHYRTKLAREHGVDVKRLQGGTVTSIQRAGSALQSTLHFHTAALDGVYLVPDESNAPPRFLAAPALAPGDVESVAWNTSKAVMQMLQKRGEALTGASDDEDRLAQEHPLLARCLAASTQGIVAVGDDAGRRVSRSGYLVESTGGSQTPGHGFDVHASVRVAARDRRGLERLCRYILAPPVSAERVSRTDDGRVVYRLKRRWRDGTEAVEFSGIDFLTKLMALIPRPGVHLLRYHGCLAPRSALRRRVVPSSDAKAAARARRQSRPQQLELHSKGGDNRWVPRIELLRHVFGADAARCRACGSEQLEVLAVVTRWDAIASVLTALGLSSEGRVLVRNRGPPVEQMSLPLPSAHTSVAGSRDAA